MFVLNFTHPADLRRGLTVPNMSFMFAPKDNAKTYYYEYLNTQTYLDKLKELKAQVDTDSINSLKPKSEPRSKRHALL